MPFIANPSIICYLNRSEVDLVDAMMPPLGDKTFKWCLAALNSRSIRVSGWMYDFTDGEPTCRLKLGNFLGCKGSIFDRQPFTVTIDRRPGAFVNWLHFCRMLIHEFEGHGTNEFGANLGRGGHSPDRYALMSYQPYDFNFLNPFLPVAGGGQVVWGLTKYHELPAFQRIAGTPIYKD